MKKIYWKLNAILGFVILLPIDFLISITTKETFKDAHARSMESVKNAWNKY